MRLYAVGIRPANGIAGSHSVFFGLHQFGESFGVAPGAGTPRLAWVGLRKFGVEPCLAALGGDQHADGKDGGGD